MIRELYLGSGPGFPVMVVLAITAMLLLRYTFFVGVAFAGLFVFRQQLATRCVQTKKITRAQMLRELGWSLLAIPVISLTATLALLAHSVWDIFNIYADPLEYGWAWLVASLPISVLIHDFYFYWMHRFAHLPGVFNLVHKVHHGAINPTPLSSLAFHPIEAVLEVFGILVVALVMPVHGSILLLLSIYVMATNAMGHLGYEIFPSSWARHPILRHVNNATNHNQHHRTFRYNFGLYTLIWDRMFGTLHPEYEVLYERVTAKNDAR